MIPARGRVLLGLALVAAAGCADDIPGIAPPVDQLAYPQALLVTPDAQRLVVLSTNFDQRYNTGRAHVFDLAALVGRFEGREPASGDAIVFEESYGDAQVSTLRIDQFAGEASFTSSAAMGGAQLVMAGRGRNSVTLFDYDPATGALSCGTPPEAGRFECAEERMIFSGDQDPFAVLPLALEADGVARIAIGHLETSRDPVDNVFRRSVSIFDTGRFEAWASADPETRQAENFNPVRPNAFEQVGGITGLAHLPAGQLGTDPAGLGAVVLLERSRAPTLTLRAFDLVPVSVAVGPEETVVTTRGLTDRATLSLSGAVRALSSRGLWHDTARGRLFLSLRYQEAGDSFNAGLQVVDVRGDEFRLVRALEFGEELGRPVPRRLPDGTQLLYVPDIRLNSIWVVDASTDAPVVVHQIRGVGDRNFDGEIVQVPLLATPGDIAFATVNGTEYGFVSNFSNSTLAVIDVSDPDPRRHRVVARLGMDIDAEGEREGP